MKILLLFLILIPALTLAQSGQKKMYSLKELRKLQSVTRDTIHFRHGDSLYKVYSPNANFTVNKTNFAKGTFTFELKPKSKEVVIEPGPCSLVAKGTFFYCKNTGCLPNRYCQSVKTDDGGKQCVCLLKGELSKGGPEDEGGSGGPVIVIIKDPPPDNPKNPKPKPKSGNP